jgi:hypothetical protein
MADFLLGAYSCGAAFTFLLGLLVRDPDWSPWPGERDGKPVPVWEVALYAAAWPLVAVWVALELRREGQR